MTLPIAVFKRVFKSKWFSLTLIVALLVGMTGALTWANRNDLLNASAQETNSFTELYFADEQKLSTKVEANRTYEVDFVIVNHHHQTKEYTYEVVVREGQTDRQTHTATIALAPGAQKTITAPFHVTQPATVATVSVGLVHEAQLIQFHVRSL